MRTDSGSSHVDGFGVGLPRCGRGGQTHRRDCTTPSARFLIGRRVGVRLEALNLVFPQPSCGPSNRVIRERRAIAAAKNLCHCSENRSYSPPDRVRLTVRQSSVATEIDLESALHASLRVSVASGREVRWQGPRCFPVLQSLLLTTRSGAGPT